MRRNYFRCPNCLLHDTRLSYEAKVVGEVFYAYCNALGVTCKSYDTLAALAHCNRNTAIKAVKQLVDAGYITFCNTKYYSKKLKRVVNGKNVYSVNLNLLNDGYTIFHRYIFNQGLTAAQLVIYCEIIFCAGNENRSWPSHKNLQEATGAGHSTVCICIKIMKKLSNLLVQLCLKKNRAYAKTSYIIVHQSEETANLCHDDNAATQAAEQAEQVILLPRPGIRQRIRAGVVAITQFFSHLLWRGSPKYRLLS